MENFAVSLYGANGQTHAFKVSAAVLWQVYQGLVESPEAELMQPMDLGKAVTPSVKPEPAEPEAVTGPEAEWLTPRYTKGTKPGFCQLSFDSKPGFEQRQELRDAGFRWSSINRVWYGNCADLPLRYDAPDLVVTPVQTAKPVQTAPQAAPQADDAAFAASLMSLIQG